MGKACKEMMCQVLMENAAKNKNLLALCSDSRGSAGMGAFAENFPQQFVEVGIAEQNLISISAGLASCGKQCFAFSPASFIASRSMEQIKVDVAYSHTNVKCVGISGGISYGALGLTHHSPNDFACMTSLPGLRVYVPSDAAQTRCLVEALLNDNEPAYIRVGRGGVPDVYVDDKAACLDNFALNKAIPVLTSDDDATDVLIIACGEMVKPSLDAAEKLLADGLKVELLDIYALKPLDTEAILKFAAKAVCVVTVEEHAKEGGLGSLVAQTLAEHNPKLMKCLCLPDAPVISGGQKDVLAYYGLDTEGIAQSIRVLVNKCKA
ncbi:MAG: transketolase C-terminal domain-containing protein [Phascolarctobacterium sp.]|nr:transketolase C-terminal domain-containing protein [Phascolarctobacterium sp.]